VKGRKIAVDQVMARHRKREHIRTKWNDLPRARRNELLYRFNDRLTRLFDALGLTGMCTCCCAVMPAGQFSHRDECPECGRREIATPFGC